MSEKENLILFSIILSFLFFQSNKSLSKKKVNVYGNIFECKSPKNSFERTRGVRNRTCIFRKEDKELIDKIRRNKKIIKK